MVSLLNNDSATVDVGDTEFREFALASPTFSLTLPPALAELACLAEECLTHYMYM